MSKGDDKPHLVEVGAEPVPAPDGARLDHLHANRRLIVKRALLATAVGGFIPIPVVDEYVSGRIRAGLLMKIAAGRVVDLPASAADLLSDPREGTTVRNATITAATLVALRLAWKKFFALLAMGRGAEEMASTFQLATLFDHYCTRVHVGGAIDRTLAVELRRSLHASIAETEKAVLVGVFRDGSRVLARSILEAPRWVSTRLSTLAQRWVSTGGNPAATFDMAADVADEAADAQWLDRAAKAVEARLSGIGNDYLGTLIGGFETKWRNRPAKPDPAAPAGGGTVD